MFSPCSAKKSFWQRFTCTFVADDVVVVSWLASSRVVTIRFKFWVMRWVMWLQLRFSNFPAFILCQGLGKWRNPWDFRKITSSWIGTKNFVKFQLNQTMDTKFGNCLNKLKFCEVSQIFFKQIVKVLSFYLWKKSFISKKDNLGRSLNKPCEMTNFLQKFFWNKSSFFTHFFLVILCWRLFWRQLKHSSQNSRI